MTKKPKRQYLGSGFIWFGEDQPWYTGYKAVKLTTKANGGGNLIKMRVGRLGGWQKVKLYAEYR